MYKPDFSRKEAALLSLTIIYGEAGTGKSEYCLSSMQALHAEGIRSMLLVPEQYAHTAETALIEKNGFLSEDIQAISFKRLAHKLLKRSGFLKDSVSRIGKSMLLSKAILQCSDSLSLYKRAAEKPGFVDAMLNLIAECKRSEVSPEMLREAAGREQPYFAMKLTELAAIYEAYQKAMDAGYTDSEDYLSLLARQAENQDFFKGICIYIDEFFRFTPAELDCIGAFLSGGARVFVTLSAPGPDAGGIFTPVIQTAQALRLAAHRAGAAVLEPVLLKEKHRFKGSPELAHFEAAYNRLPPRIYKEETRQLSLYIAPDVYTETQVLAAGIRRAVRERGLRYRDIAVIAGNPEIYADLIKTVFPVYDIPVFIDRKRPLLTHPIMIMLLSLFELMSGGIDTEALMSYIKTGYCGLTPDEADHLENFALAGRLRRQDWLDDKRFLKRANSVFYQTTDIEEADAQEAQALLALRNRVLSPLLALRTALSQSRRVADRAEAFFRFFEAICLYETVQAEIDVLKSHDDLQAAQEHGEIYNLLISLLDELVTCLGEEKLGLRRLETVISAGLSQCEISTIPPTCDQVFFGDAGRSLVKNVKALFVIGASSDAFPSPPPQEGLLQDAERSLLEKQGLSLGPDGKKIVFHNQYLVYSALNISSETMAVSYAVADLEGKSILPSPLVQRLRKLFPRLKTLDNLTAPPEPERLIAGKPSAWQYVLEHFCDDDAAAAALRTYLIEEPAYREAYAAALRHSRYSHSVSDLSPALAEALYGRRLRSSVTQLERYSACPFSYFLQYGLRAKERKILKIDAPDIGHLLHTLIELASRRIQQEHLSFGALDDDAVRRLAEETVDELLGTLFIRQLYSESRLQALLQRLKAQVTKMLQMLVLHVSKGDFEPCAFEVAFSEDGELPPVNITLPTGERITLIGRIDRIDLLRRDGEIYIKIIDYKTGSKSFRLHDVYNGLSLQLAVYLTAVTQGGEKAGQPVKPAAMFYFRLADQRVNATEKNTQEALVKQFKMSGLVLKDADIVRAMDKGISGHSSLLPARMNKDGTLSESSGSYASPAQFEKLSAHVRRTVAKLGREILNGSAAISPCKSNKSLPCQYCSFHSICAFDAATDPYRVAPPLKDDAVWEQLEQEVKA